MEEEIDLKNLDIITDDDLDGVGGNKGKYSKKKKRTITKGKIYGGS